MAARKSVEKVAVVGYSSYDEGLYSVNFYKGDNRAYSGIFTSDNLLEWAKDVKLTKVEITYGLKTKYPVRVELLELDLGSMGIIVDS